MDQNILETIAAANRERVAEAKKQVPAEEMRERALELAASGRPMWLGETAGEECTPDWTDFAFEKALAGDGIHFICECKKASPSKGLIAEHFPYLDIAREYEAAGASAISVLTEPKWFMGSNDYLREIAATVSIPCLRKDFTVDEYMIYEARTLGASAVLLICSLLDEETLARYRETADRVGLSSLVEAHDEEEVAMAVRAGARVIGVNNRNLKDFTVDVHNSERLRALAPPEVLFVAESGIKTAEDIAVLREARVNAVLIGETLMRAQDKKAMLDELRGGV